MTAPSDPAAESPAPRRRLARSRRALVVGAVVVLALVLTAFVSFRWGSADTPKAQPSASPSPSASGDPTTAQIYAALAPSVVTIESLNDTNTVNATGTGVVANADGTILTALHVVKGARSIRVTFADGTPSAATVAAADPSIDIATLAPATLPTVLVPAVLGNSGRLAVGDTVIAIGNQLGLTRSTTAGVVSGLDRTATEHGRRQPDRAHPVRRRGQPGQLRRPAGQRQGRDDRHRGGAGQPDGRRHVHRHRLRRTHRQRPSAAGGGEPRPATVSRTQCRTTTRKDGLMDTAPDNGQLATASPVEQVLYEVKKTIVGQDLLLERLLVALLSRGHILVEGVPGLAKTLAVKSLAGAIGGQFHRVQFTPDLVPADIVGTRVYHQRSGEFQVSLGPVFTNLLLADEINRAPAKVQSALLEVMQEQQVTIGRETHLVPRPFLVMATQNPIESEGTYPLPEAQVDRFMMKVLVGYPSPTEEFVIVERAISPAPVSQAIVDPERLIADAGPGRAGVRGPGADRVLGPAGQRDPPAGRGRAGRAGPVRHLRRQPARLDQPDPGRAGAGLHPGPRLRPPARPHRPGPRRAAAPAGALLRGALRRRHRRRRADPGAGRAAGPGRDPPQRAADR